MLIGYGSRYCKLHEQIHIYVNMYFPLGNGAELFLYASQVCRKITCPSQLHQTCRSGLTRIDVLHSNKICALGLAAEVQRNCSSLWNKLLAADRYFTWEA